MNTSRFFSALIIATLTFGISGGTADAADGKVGQSTGGFDYCVVDADNWGWCDKNRRTMSSGSAQNVTCDLSTTPATCTVNGVAGSIDTVWETADSDLTAFDATSEADDSEWADDEYEEETSDSEWDEEDTESESESCDDEEAEAELEYGECLPGERRTSNGLCFTIITAIDCAPTKKNARPLRPGVFSLWSSPRWAPTSPG